MNETWKPIPGMFYEASSTGRIRRSAPGANTYPGKVLKPGKQRTGYLYFSPVVGGRAKPFRVHRAVALAFHGEDNGREVNHKNGDKADNRPENLEWVTHSENGTHSYRVLGRRHWNTGRFGELNPKAKLTASDVLNIRCRADAGESHTLIAKTYGMRSSTINNIIKRRCWKHI